MGILESILDYQIKHAVFENANFPSIEEIAKLAVANGFTSLSDQQKAALKPYLSTSCSGVTNPGGHHNDCTAKLEGQALLDAYRRSDDTERLICDSCNNEEGFYDHHWERISRAEHLTNN